MSEILLGIQIHKNRTATEAEPGGKIDEEEEDYEDD